MVLRTYFWIAGKAASLPPDLPQQVVINQVVKATDNGSIISMITTVVTCGLSYAIPGIRALLKRIRERRGQVKATTVAADQVVA